MNGSTLIVDNGATKAVWLLLTREGVERQVNTAGIYHFHLTDEQILFRFWDVARQLPYPPDRIVFYSTGARTSAVLERLGSLLMKVFPEAASVEIATDLMAAARALCQRSPGLVCVMGTGSNICRYDGERITESRGGMGYILGDEGSGVALGKRLLAAYIDGRLPANLHRQLEEDFQINTDIIYKNIYHNGQPNQFLGSFAPFIGRHRDEPYLRALLQAEFDVFFRRYVIELRDDSGLPVHCLGSVAYHFRDEVRRAGAALGLTMGEFQANPVEGLVKFYLHP